MGVADAASGLVRQCGGMHSHNTRPALARSIPFWALLVVSLVLIAVGAWIVFDRLGQMESAVTTQSADAAIQVYVGPSFVFPGAVLLGAGLVGLLLALAVAAVATLRPRPDAADSPDFEDEDDVQSLPAPPAFTAAEPAHADPVIAEDPDVETPSDAVPPTRT